MLRLLLFTLTLAAWGCASSPIDTTMRYAHLRPQAFRSEIERVFGEGGRAEEPAVVYRLAS